MLRETEERLRCPYCGEPISMLVDHSLEWQTYIEDCEVCCRPINVTVRVDADDRVRLDARRGDD